MQSNRAYEHHNVDRLDDIESYLGMVQKTIVSIGKTNKNKINMVNKKLDTSRVFLFTLACEFGFAFSESHKKDRDCNAWAEIQVLTLNKAWLDGP